MLVFRHGLQAASDSWSSSTSVHDGGVQRGLVRAASVTKREPCS